ncbi:hypothetical protein ACFLUU_01175 [Chloroflexota bacterium]
MTDWILILGWGSPIGTGIFLVLLATMIFILTKANVVNKGAKKDKEKKK